MYDNYIPVKRMFKNVFIVRVRDTNKYFIMKRISLRKLNTYETSIPKMFNDDRIVKYVDIFTHDNYIFLIMKFDTDALDLLRYFNRENFGLQYTKQIAKRMLECLVLLHSQNVAHLDIKPENFIINPDTGQLTLIDFGHSEDLSVPINPNKIYGTDNYREPIRPDGLPRYCQKSDIYAFGTTVYSFITGESFSSNKFTYAVRKWSLLEHCLSPNPDERLSAEQLLCLLS